MTTTDGAIPESEAAETTSKVIGHIDSRVGKLETAFAGLSASLSGLASTLLSIDGKLSKHIEVSEATRRDLTALQIERAREQGASGVEKALVATWVTPFLQKGLLALLFAGLLAFVANKSGGASAADLAAASEAAAAKAVAAMKAELTKGVP